MEIIIAVCGLGVGFLIGFFLKKSSPEAPIDRTPEIDELKGRLAADEARLQERESAHERLMAEKERLHAEAIAAQEMRHNEALEALRRQFDETVKAMGEKLKNVTEEMLKQRQSEFAESSKVKIDQLLQPLNATIREMKDTVTANTAKHSELGGRLDAGLSTLLQHTVAAQASADRLADALKGSNRVQGEWGETVLRELLESQGLSENVHFHTQYVITDAAGKAVKNDEGNSMRPDIVLHLDRSRDVIIDSKVSLSSYLEYINATDEVQRKQALDAHIRSIENHVSQLVKKDYSSYVADGKIGLGYVIMFVPNTSALLLATSAKPDLWRKAMEKRVYIADEQTLYAALKIVSMTWSQITQAANHEKVFSLAQEMLDRVGAFMQKYVEIGNKLEAATRSYGEGMKKLRDAGQSIPQTCRKLVALGAQSKKKTIKGVPPELLGLSDETGMVEPLLTEDDSPEYGI